MKAESSRTGLLRRTVTGNVTATVVLPELSVATAHTLNVPD